MTKLQLKIIGLGLIIIGAIAIIFTGLSTLIETESFQPEKDVHTVMLPTTIERLTEGNVTDGVVEKKFVHGDTEITYSVGVENGVEETPSPRTLEAMRDSYSESEQKQIDEFTTSMMFKRFDYGTVRMTGQPMTEDLYHKTQLHVNQQLKKEFIDENFSCDNFGDLAERFVLEPMYVDGWSGSAENYIYTKALNECIDPKMQEKIDKVKAELEEVNKPN